MRASLKAVAVICVAAGLAVGREGPREVSLLAVGDLNLGRAVGQRLLEDSLEMPFRDVVDLLRSADVVMGNLESQITDQGGETRHPTDPYVFCAPPQAAPALRLAGFHVLATANNHAFDYGLRALRETLGFLREEGLLGVGTVEEPVDQFPPVVVEREGIRFAFLAYTEFVNGTGVRQGRISLFDERRAGREIARARAEADVVVVSYHGGVEYAEQPGKWPGRHMRRIVDLGADVVIGHHPHVPLGIEAYNGGLIFHSLGNFFFPQRQRYWSQRAYAVRLSFVTGGATVQRSDVRLIPLDVGTMPRPLKDPHEIRLLHERLQQQSNCTLVLYDDHFEIRDPHGSRP